MEHRLNNRYISRIFILFHHGFTGETIENNNISQQLDSIEKVLIFIVDAETRYPFSSTQPNAYDYLFFNGMSRSMSSSKANIHSFLLPAFTRRRGN